MLKLHIRFIVRRIGYFYSLGHLKFDEMRVGHFVGFAQCAILGGFVQWDILSEKHFGMGLCGDFVPLNN